MANDSLAFWTDGSSLGASVYSSDPNAMESGSNVKVGVTSAAKEGRLGLGEITLTTLNSSSGYLNFTGSSFNSAEGVSLVGSNASVGSLDLSNWTFGTGKGVTLLTTAGFKRLDQLKLTTGDHSLGTGAWTISSWNLGSGNDFVSIGGSSLGSGGTFDLGGGNDTIVVGGPVFHGQGSKAFTFNLGEGGDSVYVDFTNGYGGGTKGSLDVAFNLGAGNDTLLLTGGAGKETVDIDLGSGSNKVTIDGVSGHSLSANINFSTGNSAVYASMGSGNLGVYTFNLGTGNDTLTLAGGVAESLTFKVVGGAGTGLVSIAPFEGKETTIDVALGSSSDTVYLGDVLGSSLSTKINLGGGNDLLVLAGGKFSVDGNTDTNTWAFDLGLGADTVQGSAENLLMKASVDGSAKIELIASEGDVLNVTDGGLPADLQLLPSGYVSVRTGESWIYAKSVDKGSGKDYHILNALLGAGGQAEEYTYVSAISNTYPKYDGSTDSTPTVIDTTGAVKAAITVGSGSDTIKLGIREADTIAFGVGSGKDYVTEGFNNGFAETDDVLDLYNASDLSALSDISGGNGTLTIKVGASGADVLTLSGLGTDTVNDGHIKLALAGGAAKKLAYSSGETVNAVGADILFGAEASKNKNTAVYTAAHSDTTLKQVFLFDHTQYYNITNVDATDVTTTGGFMIIGDNETKVANTIATAGGENYIWSFNTGESTIKLGTGTSTNTYAGVDHVAWWGEYEGNETIENFNKSNDMVWLMDAETAADVKNKYTFKSSTDIAVTFGSDGSTLHINGGEWESTDAGVFEVGYGLGDASTGFVAGTLKVDIGSGKFDRKTDLYVGSPTVKASSTDTNLVIFMGNEDNESKVWQGMYGTDVRVFDASDVTTAVTLAGAMTQANTLIGSNVGPNYLWGASIDRDTFITSTKSTDYIAYSQLDGDDYWTEGVDKNDVLCIWTSNGSDLESIVTVDVDTDGFDRIHVEKDGKKADILITDTGHEALFGGLTFRAGLLSGTEYTYDKDQKKLVAK